MRLVGGKRAGGALALGAIALAGCLGRGDPVRVEQPTPSCTVQPCPAPSDERLWAGAAEVDITPPPGYPSYGSSTNGAGAMKGYWLRLKARVIVLQRGASRLALVQLDLGAASSLLSRTVAARLADRGFGPENLVLASTHTHAGPGGLFGEHFYNAQVGARGGYDPALVDLVASRVVLGVSEAIADLREARIGVAEGRLDERASSNRSREAWRENFVPSGDKIPKDEVLRDVTVLRVDTRRSADAPFTPRAAWVVLPIHGTSMPADYDSYHGDVHGLTARLFERALQKEAPGFVAAVANGAEGDVTPGDCATPRTCDPNVAPKELAMSVAGFSASAAILAHRKALPAAGDDAAVHPSIAFAYREISMRGAGTTHGRLCDHASLGAPQLAGSEVSRGPTYGAFQMYEGAVRPPSGCDATKIKGGGFLQDAIVDADDFPDVVPFQVVTIGPLALLSFPGEPTTELGRDIVRRAKSRLGVPHAAVLGLTNGYANYYTTSAEFLAQHYEGGATLYGPHQGTFAAEQLERLMGELRQPAVADYARTRDFMPGAVRHFAERNATCDATAWRIDQARVDGPFLTLEWSGASSSERCEYPSIALECDGAPLVDRYGYPASDEGFDFEVRHDGGRSWSASWTRRAPAGAHCLFVLTPNGGSPLRSLAVTIPPDAAPQAGTP